MNTLSKVEQMPFELSQDQIDLLKTTVCKEGTNDDFKIFLHVCQKTGLDPFVRQIYAVFRQDYALNKKVMSIQTGIDGYRLIAERTGKYAPGQKTTYDYDKDGKMISATAYIKKQTSDGTWHEISATAFYSEYVQTTTDKVTKQKIPTKFWQQMPHGQLGKCAEALALRKGFPHEMSNLYTKEEMAQADNHTDFMPIAENVDIVVENREEILGEFVKHYPEDDVPLIKDFLDKYSKHWNKSMKETTQRFFDMDEFLKVFNPWKEKQSKAA
jgi:phage recombination protein Bet